MAVGDYTDSMSRHARKSSSKDLDLKPTGTRHDTTYFQAKIGFYEKPRSEQR